MLPKIPATWRPLLAGETQKPYYKQLEVLLAKDQQTNDILPSSENIFHALEVTSFEKIKVLLLGQDPYPTPGHAHGLCFSVRPEVRPLPGSLKNIYKELETDIPGFTAPKHGYLEYWAQQGILLLNTVLTVRAHEANSHQKKGWEQFTDKIIRLVNEKPETVVFVLWGKKAQDKIPLITSPQHKIVTTAHPSPLSAKKFFGSKPFSQVNRCLQEAGLPAIDWQLPLEV